MSIGQYNAPKPAFGKVQGVQPRAYARVGQTAGVGGHHAVNTPAQYAPPQPSNYAEIVGNAFQGGYHPESYDGMTRCVKPVKGLRFAAGLIDLMLLSTLVAFIIVGYAFYKVANPPATPTSSYGLIISCFLLWFGYGFVMEASRLQGTVGKILTGTVIVNEDGSPLSFGQVLGRNFGKVVSYCTPFYIAYLMVLFTQNKQSLHDYMCGSFVYKKSDLTKLGGHVFN